VSHWFREKATMVRNKIFESFHPSERLTRDLRAAAGSLKPREVRYLVDSYYRMQEDRKRATSQIRAMRESDEPHEVMLWLVENVLRLEKDIKNALEAYSSNHPIGMWAKSMRGIGPVISAGLLAHINLDPLPPTVGHIWRFAGLDPTVEWKSGQKRPWNRRLKTLCWHIGESFVRMSKREDDIYGHLWATRKTYELQQNENGEYAGQAATQIARYHIGRDTEAYKWYSQGKLPLAHIHARAKRWAVKLFLSHWHWIAHEVTYGKPPPKPYVIEHLGHAHILRPPNWPIGSFSKGASMS